MEVQERAGTHVLKLEGDLTIFEAAEFHEGLVALQQQEGPIELDVSEVDQVDTSGVQLMLAAARDERFTLTGITAAIQEKLELVGCGALVQSIQRGLS